MKCDCGCGDVLHECSHKECTRKPELQRAVSTGISAGKSDDVILKEMSTRYGAGVLLTPTFQGFDTMLWIVPISVGMFAIGATIAVQRKRARASQKS